MGKRGKRVHYTNNPDAYQLNLQGPLLLEQAQWRSGKEIIRLFQSGVSIETSFSIRQASKLAVKIILRVHANDPISAIK